MTITFLGCLAVHNCEMMSMGIGKIIVLLFSAEMLFNVWRYRSWKFKTFTYADEDDDDDDNDADDADDADADGDDDDLQGCR